MIHPVQRLNDDFHDWAIKHLPASVVARPFEWLVVVLLANAGTNILLGTSQPQSALKVLPDPFYYGWAIAMVLGAVAMALGLSSIRWVEAPTSYVMEGAHYYLLGMRLLALASFVFAIAILINNGWNGLPSSTITMLFGALCVARLISIRSRI